MDNPVRTSVISNETEVLMFIGGYDTVGNSMYKGRHRNPERMAYGLLVSWCLLPVAISLFCALMMLTGRFTPIDRDGEWVMNWDCQIATITAFHMAFRVLGCVTLAFALYSVIRARKRAFSRVQLMDNPWMVMLLAILIWSVISALLSDDFSRAFWGGRYYYTGLESYFIFAGIFICATMIRGEVYRKRLVRLFCGVQTGLSILVILQVYANTFLDEMLAPERAAVFINSNFFGYLLCMAVIGFAALYLFDGKANKWIRGIYLVGFATVHFTLLLNNTFGSYLAAFFAVPVLYLFYFRSGRRFHPCVMLPAILFIAISLLDCFSLPLVKTHLKDSILSLFSEIAEISHGTEEAINAGSGRAALWMQTMVRISQRPWFGFGPDGFYGANAILNYITSEPFIPHNEFLQMAGYTGVPSLLFYMTALVALAVHHWNRIKKLDPMVLAASCMTVTYLFSSFFGNPIFNTAPYFWLFLGLMTATNEETLPVIADEETGKDDGEDATSRRLTGQGVVIAIIGVLVAAVALYAYSLWNEGEYIREEADLQAMRNAVLTVKQAERFGTLEDDGEYWYDALEYKLIPSTEAMLEPYGLGTRYSGDGCERFYTKFGERYEYDERADYTDKIIKVIVKGSDKNPVVKLEWVTAQ